MVICFAAMHGARMLEFEGVEKYADNYDSFDHQ